MTKYQQLKHEYNSKLEPLEKKYKFYNEEINRIKRYVHDLVAIDKTSTYHYHNYPEYMGWTNEMLKPAWEQGSYKHKLSLRELSDLYTTYKEKTQEQIKTIKSEYGMPCSSSNNSGYQSTVRAMAQAFL